MREGCPCTEQALHHNCTPPPDLRHKRHQRRRVVRVILVVASLPAAAFARELHALPELVEEVLVLVAVHSHQVERDLPSGCVATHGDTIRDTAICTAARQRSEIRMPPPKPRRGDRQNDMSNAQTEVPSGCCSAPSGMFGHRLGSDLRGLLAQILHSGVPENITQGLLVTLRHAPRSPAPQDISHGRPRHKTIGTIAAQAVAHNHRAQPCSAVKSADQCMQSSRELCQRKTRHRQHRASAHNAPQANCRPRRSRRQSPSALCP